MFFAGIDIGGTTVKSTVMNEFGRIVYQSTIGSVKGDPYKLAENIASGLSGFRSPITAAGLSCAGTVNRITHTITASNLKWMEVPFESIMEEVLHCPVAADNDVAGALCAESRAGVCAGEKYVVYISLGTGIGGAFLVDGKPFRGFDNTGGEIGHFITHADGLPCPCGGRGCFEQYASSGSMTKRAGVPVREIFRQVRAGNPQMIAILNDYVHELCIGLAGIVHIFRPHMVVLGGGIGAAGEELLGRVRAEMEGHCPSIPNTPMPVFVSAMLGNLAGSVGGCFLAGDLMGVPIRVEDMNALLRAR